MKHMDRLCLQPASVIVGLKRLAVQSCQWFKSVDNATLSVSSSTLWRDHNQPSHFVNEHTSTMWFMVFCKAPSV